MKKSIFNLLIIIFALTFVNCSDSSPQLSDEIYVVSWNVENLFDTIDDEDKIDEWFLPESEIKWTEKKLNDKLENLAKVISFMNAGNGPDILGVQEVEHKHLLEKLLKKLNLSKNYKIAYKESPDVRGIDNALIYNSDLFTLEHSEGLNVDLGNGKKTRDILYCKLNFGKEVLNIFVNHWPSRREGLKKSEHNRIKAAETLMAKINSFKNPESSNIIILGDFNDMPSNISINKVLGAKNINCGANENNELALLNITTKAFMKGHGTYKYKNHWNMLDQIIISNSLNDNKGFDYKCKSFEIIKPEFVIQKTGKYKGTSLPTFGGRKYLGGYSDHFSVGAKFQLVK